MKNAYGLLQKLQNWAHGNGFRIAVSSHGPMNAKEFMNFLLIKKLTMPYSPNIFILKTKSLHKDAIQQAMDRCRQRNV